MDQGNEEYKKPEYFKWASPDRYEILKELAKINRSNQTLAEQVLWNHIKGNALGTKFLRQYIIKDYIADFISLYNCLVIEVDGGYHFSPEQMEWDAYRTAELEKLGFKVIRFRNEEVLYNIEHVIDTIIYEINHVSRNRIITKY